MLSMLRTTYIVKVPFPAVIVIYVLNIQWKIFYHLLIKFEITIDNFPKS
jgi:hypothetical protein